MVLLVLPVQLGLLDPEVNEEETVLMDLQA